MEMKDILKLSLKDKCYFLSGIDNWHTKELKAIKLSSLSMSDGPYGIRKVTKSEGFGLDESVKATAFPCNVVLGATWNKDLAYKFGAALSTEAKHYDVDMVLGPGICIKRSPLCGRNFEYISEDPYLAGLMASSYINGLQENGVGCSLKHFACNNQETYRSSINEVVDERSLREIYLKGFEIAVKNSQPMSIMTSYNQINGVFSSDNKWLLTDVCRNDWGFKGFFESDWGGCAHRLAAVEAGEDLEMPTSGSRAPESLITAVKEKKISEDTINERVLCLANSIEAAQNRRVKNYKCDFDKNYEVAKEVSDEGMVLLKNDNETLPLNKDEKVLFVGDFLTFDKFEASGSSRVNANKVVGIKEAAKGYKNIEFARGYNVLEKGLNNSLVEEALSKSKNASKVVLFLGLSDNEESEGYDRKTLSLPKNQLDLFSKIYAVNKNIIVVLINGAPVEMPFIDKTNAILEAYLGGEAYGESIVDILFNKVNPSGRIGETFPYCIKDTPCNKYYPGGTNASYYKESIFVGYRYYTTFHKEVLFPFGYGLSYTNFEYRNLSLYLKNDAISITCKIKNVGKYDGKEVVEVYVGGPSTTVFKPRKELKDFTKIFLKAGEEKQVHFEIPFDNLRYYNTKEHKWVLENGFYKVFVGGDSFNSMLNTDIEIKSNDPTKSPYYRSQLLSYYNGKIQKVSNTEFEVLYEKKLPKENFSIFRKVDENNCFRTCRHTLTGKVVYNQFKKNKSFVGKPLLLEGALTLPFRQLFLMYKDAISNDDIKLFYRFMNGSLKKEDVEGAKRVFKKMEDGM